jgi:hypothetical protein
MEMVEMSNKNFYGLGFKIMEIGVNIKFMGA